MEHSRLPRREAGRLRVWPSAVWAGGRAVAPSQAEQGSLLCRPRPPRSGGRRTGVSPKHHPLTVPLTFGNPVPPLVLIARSWLLLSVY